MKPKISATDHYFYSVLTAIALIACIVFFNSCAAYRAKICLTCATKTEIKDSISIKQTVKHDTTYIDVAGPIEYLESPCDWLCDSLGKLKPVNLVSKKNGITQSLRSFGNVLIQKCDIDSLIQVNTTLTNERNHWRSVKEQVPQCFKEHITDSDIFWLRLGRWLLWIDLGIVALFLIRLYLKKQFPIFAKWIP